MELISHRCTPVVMEARRFRANRTGNRHHMGSRTIRVATNSVCSNRMSGPPLCSRAQAGVDLRCLPTQLPTQLILGTQVPQVLQVL